MSESDDDCQIVSDQPQVSSDSSDPSVKLMDFDEVCEEDGESLDSVPESVAREAEANNIEYYTVSETNPRCAIIISYSHINRPHYMGFPAQITSKLPSEKVQAVLKSKGKSWSMFYSGHNRAKALELKGWRKFVEDNEVKIGDCCVFELMEASNKRIEFKVVILKTDPSFRGVARESGTAEEPIIL